MKYLRLDFFETIVLVHKKTGKELARKKKNFEGSVLIEAEENLFLLSSFKVDRGGI